MHPPQGKDKGTHLPMTLKNVFQGKEQKGKKFKKKDYRGQGRNNNKCVDNFSRRNQGEEPRNNQRNEQRQGAKSKKIGHSSTIDPLPGSLM